MGFNMFLPTRILLGAGMLNKLHAQKLPGQKAMIVISNGKSTRENGYLERLENELRSANVESVVFDKVKANPLKSTVMEGASFFNASKCDFIVALGGGSVIDAAKAVAMMATNEGDLWDYVYGGSGEGKPLPNRPIPVIAITTTAGTGSEVDNYGVITHDDNNEKIALGGIEELFPLIAIVDPELMISIPPAQTAYQGFDALFHSVEGYISKYSNLMSDMYALTAIENISANLAKAVKDGNDLKARERVAFGSMLSGIVMVAGTLVSQHSLEHAMSAYHHDLPHGAGLIMLSKPYFTYMITNQACDEKFIRMAKAMGMDDAKEPMDFIRALEKLKGDCEVANLRMSDYGIRPEEFLTLANNAKETMGALFKCDRIKLGVEDCAAIFEKAYQ